jgi:hypothetical protein
MRAHILTAIVVLFFLPALRAQDRMYRMDQTMETVKIIEVGTESVKYKPWDNPDGPVYVIARGKVHRIEYANGTEEIVSLPKTPLPRIIGEKTADQWELDRRRDSLRYFGYENNISVNFFSFFNNEFSLLYQRELFSSGFNVVVPLGIGVQAPNLTNAIYFRADKGVPVKCDRKLLEIGLGVNYYPRLTGSIHYYIGPVFRYIKYEAVQTGWFPYGKPGYGVILSKDVSVSRYTFSITNGVILRTRSRLTFNLFGSVGFKSDLVDNPIADPTTGEVSQPLDKPMGMIFWSGLNLGFNF